MADINAGDERDSEIGLEWADDRTNWMDRTGLSKSVLHEITRTERQEVRRLDLLQALFEKMQTQYKTGLGVFISTEAAKDDACSSELFASRADP